MSQFANLDSSFLAQVPPRFRKVTDLLRQGKHQEAAAACKLLLQRDNFDPEGYHLLGLAAAGAGAMDDAVDNFRQAIVLSPKVPTYFFNLGNAYTRLQRHLEATIMFRNALELAPEDPACWFNLGNSEHSCGNNESAEAAFSQAVKFQPNYVRAWLNLGNVRRELGRYEDAKAALERAVSLSPDSSGVLNNLGNLLREMGRPDEASSILGKLLNKHPEHFRAWNNYGSSLRESGHLAEAIVAYRRAIAIQPDHAQAHLNLAMALLAAGDSTEGWEEYEWRWTAARESKGYFRDFQQPLWNGEEIAGQTILLHAEQGLGDALQFIRYAPLVKARGAHVIVEAPPELLSIFQRIPEIDLVIPRGSNLPDFQWHSPFMSLPRACCKQMPGIPATIPYLNADTQKSNVWRSYFQGESRLKVGLVWAGNPRRHDPVSHMIDRRRSIHLDQLEAILNISGVRFYSLQKGESQTELAQWIGRIDDLGSRFSDFDDTAAALNHIDLVITVDTSVAHIAGALGKPVWMLSRFDACWRWGDAGENTPWYPSMRIFRQKRYGDWQAPIEALAQALTQKVEAL